MELHAFRRLDVDRSAWILACQCGDKKGGKAALDEFR
jgi:hypothetical protein